MHPATTAEDQQLERQNVQGEQGYVGKNDTVRSACVNPRERLAWGWMRGHGPRQHAASGRRTAAGGIDCPGHPARSASAARAPCSSTTCARSSTEGLRRRCKCGVLCPQSMHLCHKSSAQPPMRCQVCLCKVDRTMALVPGMRVNGQLADADAKCDVLCDCHVVEQGVRLENKADASLLHRLLRHIQVCNTHILPWQPSLEAAC
jgi:hypothetical protein